MPATNMWRDGGMKLYTKLSLRVRDAWLSHESIMLERLYYRGDKLSRARTLDTPCRRRRCGRRWLYKNKGPVGFVPDVRPYKEECLRKVKNRKIA
ncbi:hypothetical protein K439DRAFT_369804 [Ramaria rubella]|nr:hypothetical protein K439DRAFT_369804 [Ramaria rubella]